MRREFLQLAKTFKMGKDDPSGMFISEKLDGSRCFWDGGVTRGVPTKEVPWANTINPKTGKTKDKIKPVATGLWSRYGNPIMAPDWWLNALPQMFLDGELFAGRGNFQMLRSIVGRDVPDDEAWREVQFAVFGTPSPANVFQVGEIKNTNFHLTVDPEKIDRFITKREDAGVIDEHFCYTCRTTFDQELKILQSSLPNTFCYLHRHVKLPENRCEAERHMEKFLDKIVSEGGEGAILRDPNSIWTPKRVSSLLKLKPSSDASGTVVGFTSGRETNKGSKLRGLIGAVILNFEGKRFELSGFTDEERKFTTEEQTKYAWNNPGKDMPEHFQGKHFKVGDTVEFHYRELSKDGLPKEGRFYRHV